MIVYVVLQDIWGEGSYMHGVFSSTEKANAFIEQELDLVKQQDYFIVEKTLDE